MPALKLFACSAAPAGVVCSADGDDTDGTCQDSWQEHMYGVGSNAPTNSDQNQELVELDYTPWLGLDGAQNGEMSGVRFIVVASVSV